MAQTRKRPGSLWLAALAALLLPGAAAAQDGAKEVDGRVVDAETGDIVIGALVQVGLTADYTVSNEYGNFAVEIPADTPPVLVVSAPGYAKQYEPVPLDSDDRIRIALHPEPIELEGFDVAVVPYKTRLKRRRNAALTRSYVLEGALLTQSTADNVWDLVGKKHGFSFHGYSDYGCPLARIYGNHTTVGLYVNDRPIPIHLFEEFAPQDFAMVEVFAYGSSMWAYTQDYIDWMTENNQNARPYATNPGLCPPAKVAGFKRGRPVGPGTVQAPPLPRPKGN